MAVTKKKKKKIQGKPAKERPRSGDRSLEGVPARALQAELHRRQRELVELRRKRNTASRQLAKLEEKIAQYETAGGVGPRKRAKNPVILVDALRKLLNNRALTVSAAAEAVQHAGYKTTSPNFRTIVNQTLLGNKRTFKKVSRGTYTMR